MAPYRFLIGTHNRDKAFLASGLLKRANPTFVSIYLAELGVKTEIIETGTLLDRATRKALAYAGLAALKQPGSFDFVMGIDDAIIFSGQDFDPLDSSRATDAVLSGAVKIGEAVMILHAFTIYSPARVITSMVVEVPFTYIGPTHPVINVPKTYPLKKVLAIPGSSEPLSSLSDVSYIDYHWRLCSERFLESLAICGVR